MGILQEFESVKAGTEKLKTMVERGWSKHTEFFGQREKEEHGAALVADNPCYFCIAELEEQYGIEQALKMRVIRDK